MFFYSLYSKSQKRYNVPFLAVDDGDAVDKVVKMVSSQSDAALLSSLDDLQIEAVAYFMPTADTPSESPVEALLNPGLVMGDLHKNLPLPPTIKKRLDKFYAGGDPSAE